MAVADVVALAAVQAARRAADARRAILPRVAPHAAPVRGAIRPRVVRDEAHALPETPRDAVEREASAD